MLGVSIAAKDWSHWVEEIKEGLQAQSSVPSDVQDTQHILKKKMREESNDFTKPAENELFCITTPQ